MLDEQDYKNIEARLFHVFMPRSECDSQMESIKNKQNNIEVRLAVIENEVKKSTKLQWTILVVVLTAVVTAIMGMILK